MEPPTSETGASEAGNLTQPPPSKPREKTVRRKTSDLSPWRDVIQPNSDVTDGSFRKSDFAANLQEVYEGKAKTDEYANPTLFFNQTYITPGLRGLLINTCTATLAATAASR